MPTNGVKQPTPLPERPQPEETRLLAEAMHLLARVFIRLDEHRGTLIAGEAQDDFHTLAVDMTGRLDALALAFAGDSPPVPYSDLQEHGLTGGAGEVKRNTLRRCVEEFFAALGRGPEAATMPKRAVAAAAAAFEAGAFILDSAGFKVVSEGCATAKSICDMAVRRFDSWSCTFTGTGQARSLVGSGALKPLPASLARMSVGRDLFSALSGQQRFRLRPEPPDHGLRRLRPG